MKCDNCANDALYTISTPAANPVNYCGIHIPNYLRKDALAGAYPVPAPVVEAPASAPTKSKKADPAPVEPEAPVETPATPAE